MNNSIRRSGIRITLLIIASLIILYLMLLIPCSPPDIPPVPESSMTKPFLWNQDSRWDFLEKKFAEARKSRCDSLTRPIDSGFMVLNHLLKQVDPSALQPSAPEFRQTEELFFSLAPLIAACPERVPEFFEIASEMRSSIKKQSIAWDMNDRTVRETLYRLLYGQRSALEEVIMQLPDDQKRPTLMHGIDEKSATPWATMLNVQVHSGDILVSRGGAPTSALIARGNDFQGNFSHVALVYVDSISGQVSVIESHIERGVAIATANEYFRDTKLRVMVLRLRHDLPALQKNPLLPGQAAEGMLARAQNRHYPYDFPMDYSDSSKLFCSEVVSLAYRTMGVNLWMGMSHISSPGLRRWLADFGVSHFETQEPSDLEYDPQLTVVAEWKDSETMRKDRIDNAVTDAMLEGAERGDQLGYNLYFLPLARILKAYCVVINWFGFVGPIPEGMTATTSLKHEYYAAKHRAAAGEVIKAAGIFKRDHGYEPPYWELLRMARATLAQQQ